MIDLDTVDEPGADAHREGDRNDPSLSSSILFWLGAGPLFASALIDFPRRRMVGPMTALGALTIAEGAIAALVLLFCAKYTRQLLARLAPFALFLFWAVATVFWAPPDVKGAQNLAAYLLFGTALASAGALASRSRTRTEQALERGVRIMDVGGIALIAASMLLRGWPPDIDKVPWFVVPRAVALAGLAPLAWHLARWVYGRAWEGALAALWLAAIFLTLSRMATITALVLVGTVVFIQYRTARQVGGAQQSMPRVALATLAIAGVLAGVLYVAPFRARVFRGASSRVGASISINDINVARASRFVFWSYVANSAAESPIIGKGIGSSQAVVSARWSDVGHPHNDYLRVWHDLGMIGLAALLCAFVTWFRVLARELRTAARHQAKGVTPQLELAGFLALIALALPMLTDNAIVYPFVVGPVGILVGAGLGAQALVRIARLGPDTNSTAAALFLPIDKARFAWRPKYRIRRKRRRES